MIIIDRPKKKKGKKTIVEMNKDGKTAQE